MKNVVLETKVDGLGKVFYAFGTFDEASQAVIGKCGGLISLRDLAYARIQEGKGSSFYEFGSYAQEGSLFAPNSQHRRIMLRKSLMLEDPAGAVDAQLKGCEYLLPSGFNVEQHLAQIGEDNYFILNDQSNIPTNRFGEDARTVWAFKDQAAEYGRFLKDAKNMTEFGFSLCPNNDKAIDALPGPWANQLYFRSLSRYSDQAGIEGNMRGDIIGLSIKMVRGVEYHPLKAIAQKDMAEAKRAIGSYTSEQLQEAVSLLPKADLLKLADAFIAQLGRNKLKKMYH